MSENKKVLKREEVSDKYKWRLDAMYADDQLWEDDFNKIKQMLPR